MEKETKEYAEEQITITIVGNKDAKECTEIVKQILAEKKAGKYTISMLGDIPRVSYTPLPAIGDVEPGADKGMILPPDYFSKPDPTHPFKKYDPDNDELFPPGGNSSHFI